MASVVRYACGYFHSIFLVVSFTPFCLWLAFIYILGVTILIYGTVHYMQFKFCCVWQVLARFFDLKRVRRLDILSQT